MSQGQGKLRASNEARGLSSSTNDVEMMVNHAEKDQPMDVSVTICPSTEHVTTPAVITDENNCMDDTSTNDQCKSQMPQNVPTPAAVIEEQLTFSPDLAKTLKTVKALKKTFRDTFLKEKEEQNEQNKKTNILQTDNIVGKEDEKMEEAATANSATSNTPSTSESQKAAQSNLTQISAQNSQRSSPIKLPETEIESGADIRESEKKESTIKVQQQQSHEEMQSAPPLIVKEHGDPQQQKLDADSDKDNSSLSPAAVEHSNASAAATSSNVAFKTSTLTVKEEREDKKEEVIQPTSSKKVVGEQVKLTGQVSSCQKTNNYSLSPPKEAARAEAEVATVTVAESLGHSKNASDYGKLDTTQNDLECKQASTIKQHHTDDPGNSQAHPDELISHTLGQNINQRTARVKSKKLEDDEKKQQEPPQVQERSTNLPWNLLKELDSSNNNTSSSTIGSKARAKSEKAKDDEKKQQESPKVQERSTNLPWNLLKELDAPNNRTSSSAVESTTRVKSEKVEVEQKQQQQPPQVKESVTNLPTMMNNKEKKQKQLTQVQETNLLKVESTNLPWNLLKELDTDNKTSSPAIGSRQLKKSASMEKAEQWLKERMEEKARSRKNSELSDRQLEGNELKHWSVYDSEEKVTSLRIPIIGRTNELNARTNLLEAAFNKAVSPPLTKSPTNTTLPSRFRGMSQSSKNQDTPQPTPPRRGSVFENSRGSSGCVSTATSRAGSPTSTSRATSSGPTGKPYYSATKMATVVPTPNSFGSKIVNRSEEENSKSGWKDVGKASSSSYFEKAQNNGAAFKNDTSISASRRSSKDEDFTKSINSRKSSTDFIPSRRPSVGDPGSTEKPKTIREFSPTPVVLVRPSTFIQGSSDKPEKTVAKPFKDFNPVVKVGPSTFIPTSSPTPPTNASDKNQDKIPSRFRKAMQHNNHSSNPSSGMVRSKSIHELNEASLGLKATGLQDQIRQARADHRKVFDDAQSHTTYGSRGFQNSSNHQNSHRGTRETPEWLHRSMRSLRASPASSRI
jgi:hypothetical protein